MAYGKRWHFYRVQTGIWGFGFQHNAYEWGFMLGPFWLGRGYR